MPERRLSANAQLANAAFISLILLLTLRQSEIWRPTMKQIAKHSAYTNQTYAECSFPLKLERSQLIGELVFLFIGHFF